MRSERTAHKDPGGECLIWLSDCFATVDRGQLLPPCIYVHTPLRVFVYLQMWVSVTMSDCVNTVHSCIKMWHSDNMSRLPDSNTPDPEIVPAYVRTCMCVRECVFAICPCWQMLSKARLAAGALCASPNDIRKKRFWLWLVLFFSTLPNSDKAVFILSLRYSNRNHFFSNMWWDDYLQIITDFGRSHCLAGIVMLY